MTEKDRALLDKVSAAWWLRGPHFQTTWGRLGRSSRQVKFRREVVATRDGDELVLDHVDGPEDSPRVLLLHGLEGSSYAVYIQGLARQFSLAGWHVTALNFRSCARDPQHIGRRLQNLTARLYHSGETGDLSFVVDTLTAREPGRPLYAVGISLGGNVLLKWLGETGARSRVEGAVTISVPYDLAAAARHLEHVGSRFYVRHFLKTLRAKALDITTRFGHIKSVAALQPARIEAARTFYQFDDAATAPLHGFQGADDYYRKCSSIRFLDRIEVPTLCISSEDDPFLPADVIRRAQSVASGDVEIVTTRWGGHAAFISGPWPWRARYWAEERAVAWLTARPA
ncbi:MAG TPA: alpha/beta fold hydrolase [Polyangia bacterium]|nr:alpha/beta fold hydrolase [Polyangia bacterium]